MQATEITVGDLAHTAVATTSTTTTVREAATELAGENRGVLLVTGAHGMVGILSERDVVRAIGEGEDPDELRVEHVMTEQVVVIDRSSTLHDALAMMDESQIRHLVVSDSGTPIGVISLRDVTHALLAQTTAVRG